MKILRVISSMNPSLGGPCQGIRNSIPELHKLGVTNEVVSLDDPNDVFLWKDPFVINAIGGAKGAWGYNSRLSNWLEDNLARFDVVIIHGLWQFYSYATSKAIKNFRLRNGTRSPKVFVMPHGMLDPWFQKAKGREMKALRNWFYWKLIEKNVVNQADGLLFTASEELLLARETFSPYYPKKEINVGYGVPSPPIASLEMFNSFQQICPEITEGSYILFLSRIHVKKGVDILVNAYLKLKKAGMVLPKLVIAGPGLETDYGKEILALAESDNDIFFPGMLTGNAKWGAYYGCQSFILPSHQENFGISVVEALACGKPVLISDQINIFKEIIDGNGGLVSSDSIEGVIQLLTNWCLLTIDKKDYMSIMAKKVFHDFYAIEPAAKKFKRALE